MLSIVQQKLGDYAPDVIAGAADEVLGILKGDALKASELSQHLSPGLICQTIESCIV